MAVVRLLVSGSPHPKSANSRLLQAVALLDPTREYRFAGYLSHLPVFQPALDRAPWPDPVLRFRRDLLQAEAAIISTPAYLHNIPGVLKNAMDWLASSGEMADKPALAMTFTPSPPRGERAMQSLLWSLGALDARIALQMSLYQRDAQWDEKGDLIDGEISQMLREALAVLERA